MRAIDEIRPCIEQKLAEIGLELYEIKYAPAGRNSVLKVFIDKESGVTIDDCEAASNEISVLLDVENFSATPYRIEVSSPGADRPLKTERDFRRARGRAVRMLAALPDGTQKTVAGTVVGSGPQSVRIETSDGAVDVPLSQIVKAQIELSLK